MRTIAIAVITGLASLAGCGSSEVSVSEQRAAPQYQSIDARRQLDPARSRIWTLTPEGVSVYDARRGQKIALAIPGWVAADTAYGCLPDLALGPKGEAVVTSNVIPTLWKVDAETLAVSEHPLALNADGDRDVGFSGLVYSAAHGAFFAISDQHKSLWRIDASLTRGEKVRPPAAIEDGCEVAMAARLAALGLDLSEGRLAARGSAQ